MMWYLKRNHEEKKQNEPESKKKSKENEPTKEKKKVQGKRKRPEKKKKSKENKSVKGKGEVQKKRKEPEKRRKLEENKNLINVPMNAESRGDENQCNEDKSPKIVPENKKKIVSTKEKEKGGIDETENGDKVIKVNDNIRYRIPKRTLSTKKKKEISSKKNGGKVTTT